MTFDEQLTQAFDTLTERLRGEVDQEVERRVAAIAAAAPADETAASASASASASVSASVSAAAAPDDDRSRERLAAGFEAIDKARSLTDVLDTLVDFAREESPRGEVWLIRGGRPHLWRSPGSGAAGDETAPWLDDGIPLTISGVTVALMVAEPRTANDEPGTPNAERRTSNVALLTCYAAKSLEALTALKVARALTQPARPDHDTADRGTRIAEGLRIAEADSDPRSEEDTSARRYARLLVSEIKLYHEPAVIDGRRDRDLATRLGGEIARARVMYEQRVPPHVRDRADYFRDELVRTLCNGDTSLLEVRS